MDIIREAIRILRSTPTDHPEYQKRQQVSIALELHDLIGDPENDDSAYRLAAAIVAAKQRESEAEFERLSREWQETYNSLRPA